MNQTTTNLPNRTSLQQSNSLLMGKRMTLPLTGRSLRRGVFKGAFAAVGLVAAVTVMVPIAKAASTNWYAMTNSNVGTWTSNSFAGWGTTASNGAASSALWDSVNGSNSTAYFSISTNVAISGTVYLNALFQTASSGLTQNFSGGILNFASNSTNNSGWVGIYLKQSGVMNFSNSIVATNVNFFIVGQSIAGSVNLFSSNNFSNSLISIGNGPSSTGPAIAETMTVSGTNYGGSYLVGSNGGYTGTLTVNAGAGGLISNASSITVSTGSTVNYNNTNASNLTNSAIGSTTLTMAAGSAFNYNTTGASNVMGTVAVNVVAGGSGVKFGTTSGSGTNVLNLNLTTGDSYVTLYGNLANANNAPGRINVSGTTTNNLINGILPWMINTSGGAEAFVTIITNAGGTNWLQTPTSGLQTTNGNLSSAVLGVASNTTLNGAATLTTSATNNSLSLYSNAFNLNGNTLTLNSGGLAFNGSNSAITNGTLTVATNALGANFKGSGTNIAILYAMMVNAGTIGANIVDPSSTNPLSLVISGGANTLTLSGTNSYTGQTIIESGTLNLANSGSQTLSGAISGLGALTQSGTGTTTLSGSNSITNMTISAGAVNFAASQSVASNANTNALSVGGGTAIFGTSGTTNNVGYQLNVGAANTNSYLYVSNGAVLAITNRTQIGNTGSNETNIVVLGSNGVITNTGTYITVGNNGAANGGSATYNALSNNGGTLFAGALGLFVSKSSSKSTNIYSQTAGSGSVNALQIGAYDTSDNNQFLITGGTFSIAGYGLARIGGGFGTTTYETNTLNTFSNGGGLFSTYSIAFGDSAYISNANSGNITNQVILGGGTTTIGAGGFANGYSNTFTGYTNQIIWNGGVMQAGGSAGATYLTNIANTLVTISNSGGTFDINGFNNTIAANITGSGALTVTNSSNAAAALTLSGSNSFNGLTLNSSTATVTASGSSNALGAGALTLSAGTLNLGGYTFTNTLGTVTGGTLTNGTIANNGGTYTFNNTGAATVSANLTGSDGLTQGGSGTTTLTGSNSYTGGTTLAGGILALGSTNALGSSGTISFSGGTLQFTTNVASTDYSSRFSTAASQAYSFDTAGTNATLAGNLSSTGGTLSLTNSKAGNGTLTLTGNDSFTGTTTVNTGSALNVGGAGTLGSTSVVDNGKLLIGSTANIALGTLSGNGTFAQNGSGTTTLSGNNSFTGSTAVNGGNLTIASGASLTGSAVTVNTGGTLGGSGTLSTVTLNAGGTIAPSGVASSTASTLTVSSLVVNGGTYTWNYQGSANDLITASGTIDFTALTGGKQLTIGAFTNATSAAWPTGSTNFTLMTATGGFVGFNSNSFNYNSFSTLSGNIGTWSIGTNGNNLVLSYVGGQLYSLIAPAGSQQQQSVNTNALTGSLSAVALTGGGEYVLNLSNSYAGGTTIGAGTLTANGSNSFGASSGIQIGTLTNGGAAATLNINTAGGSVTNAITVFGNGTNTITGTNTGTVSYTGNVSLATNVTLASVAGGNVLLSGVISGAGTVTAAGAGTVTLASSNSYTGGTVLNGGTVALSTNGALGSGAVTASANSTLQALTSLSISNAVSLSVLGTLTLDPNGNAFTNAGSIGGAGSLTVQDSTGNGTVTFSGANTITGNSTIKNNGNLVFGYTGANALQVNAGQTLTLSGSGTTSFNPTATAQSINVQAGANLIITNTYINITNAGLGFTFGGSAGTIQIGSSTLNGNSYNNGIASGANETLIVNSGGVITNAFFKISGNNGMVMITNGGQVFASGPNGTNGYVDRSGMSNQVVVGSTNGTTSLYNLGSGVIAIGSWGNGQANQQYDQIQVGSGGLITNFSGMNVGYGQGNSSNDSFNQFVVTNGGVAVNNTNNNINIGGNGTNNNSNSIIITGAGSLLNANQFTGGSIQVGSLGGTNYGNNLQVLNGGVLTNAGTIFVNQSNSYVTISGGTLYAQYVSLANANDYLYLSNNGTTLGSLIALTNGNLVSGSGTVTLQGNGGIDAATFNVTNSANMNGAGALTVNGSGGTGTLTLSGSNSYQGGTVINSGTLGFTTGSAFGTGTVTNGTSLLFTGSGQQSNDNAFTGSGSLTVSGLGTLTMTGSDAMSGGVTVKSGGLTLSGTTLTNSALTVTNAGYANGFTFTNANATNVLIVSSTHGMYVGQYIAGYGIAAGSTITAIGTGSITLSANTTGSNTAATPGSLYTSAGVVEAYGSTLTNVTVAGNGSAYANASGQSGSAGSVNFSASNTTINGTLTIQGPASGTAYLLDNAANGSVSTNPYGYAQMNNGVVVTNLVVNGRLDVLGTGSLSLSNISGTGNGNTYYGSAGGGSGGISLNNTYSNANSAGGYGNVLNFVGGSSFLGINQIGGTFFTFTQSGPTNAVKFGVLNGGGLTTSTYYFSGGNWFFSQIGQGNSSQQANGTNYLINGANLTVGTSAPNHNGGVWVVGNNGTMTFQTNASASSSEKSQGQTFGLIVSNTGTLNMLGSYQVGGTTVLTNTTFYMTNNGGSVNISGAVTVGTAGATNDINNFVTTNGGVTTISNNLTVGTTGSTTTVNGINTVTLAGGTLSVAGTLGAGTNTGEVNSFVWTGGTLAAGTIIATNTTWNGANSSISNSTLYNTAGILAPGGNGAVGSSTITGNYVQSGSAALALDLPSATFGSYDTMKVSGTANLGGDLLVNLGGFTPASTNLFQLLTASSVTNSLNGGAHIVTVGSTNGVVTSDGFGIFTITNSGTALKLTNYVFNQYTGSGNWGTGGTNAWTAGVDPNTAAMGAYFGNNGNGSVTLDQSRTVSALLFSNAAGSTLASSGGAVLNLTNNPGVTTNASLTLVNGSGTISAGLNLQSGLAVADTVGASSTLTLSGNIQGTSGNGLTIASNNSGWINLSGSNSYTGVTTVNGGTLELTGTNALSYASSMGSNNLRVSSNAALVFAVGGANAFSSSQIAGALSGGSFRAGSGLGYDVSGTNYTVGSVSGYGLSSLGLYGSGTASLSVDNSSLTGLVLGASQVNVTGSSNALGGNAAIDTVAGNRNITLDLGGTTQSLGGLRNAATSGVLTLQNGTLSFTNATQNAGYNNIILGAVNQTANSTLVGTMLSQPGTYTSVYLNSSYNPSNGVISNIGGSTVLAGSNSGVSFAVGGGSVDLENNYAMAGQGALGYFDMMASGTLTSANGFTNRSSSAFISFGSNLTFGGNIDLGAASISLAGGSQTLNVTNGTLTLTNGIASGGMVTKTGSGTLILNGVNNATGTALNGGTILALGANSLGANLALSSGLLDLGGNNDTFNTVAFNGNAYTVTNGSYTVTSGYTASNTTVAQSLSGGGVTFKANGGTVFLTSTNNSYTGGTYVSNGATLYSTFNAGTTYTATNAGSRFVAAAAKDPNWTPANVASVVLDSGAVLAIDATGTNYQMTSSLTNGVNFTLGTYSQDGSGTVTLADPSATYTGVSAIALTGGTLDLGTTSLAVTNVTFVSGTLQNGTLTNSGVYTTASNTTSATVTASLGGTAGLNVGNGSLTLSGSNSYTGTTTVSGGVLVASNANALGTGALNVSSGTLKNDAYNFAVGAVTLGNGTISGTGTLTGASYTATNTGNAQVSESLAGTGGFTQNGTGTTTLSGSNSITNMTISAGAVNFAGSQAVASNANTNALTVGGGTAIFGTSGTTNNVGYQLNVGAANTNSYLYVSNGAVLAITNRTQIGNTGSNETNIVVLGSNGVITNTGTYITVGNNGAANGGSATYNALSNNGGTLFAGALGLFVSKSSSKSTNIYSQTAGSGSVNALQIGAYDTSDNNQFLITGGTFSIAGYGLARIGGGFGTTTYETNTLNTFSNGGGLFSTYSIAFGDSAYISNANSGNITNQVILGGGTTTIGAGGFANGYSNTFTGYTNQIIWNGGVMQAGGSAGATYLTNIANTLVTISNSGGIFDINGFNNTIAANITGAGGLTVTNTGGTGTLTLSGTNSYVGGTLINGGTLAFTSSNALSTGGVTNNATLAYTGSGAQTLSNFVVSGTGSFVSAGTGTLTLTGNNSFGGAFSINSGVLGFTSSAALGTTGAITDNATLLYSGSAASTLANNISGTGGITVASGNLTITGSINNYGGSTLLTLNSGANVTLGGSNSFIVTNSTTTAAIQVNSNATLSIASANALTPSVSAYNPGGTNFSTNATRVTLLSVIGGQVFFTNSGVTTTIGGGTNIASLYNGVATNINVNENILITGTGNGATNMVISNGATLAQYAPAGNQATSFTLQSNAIMQIGNGGTYVANLGNAAAVNSFTIDKGGTLQIAAGGVYTNTSYSGGFNLGYSAGMNYVTNAGTFYLSNGFAMNGGTNEFDNTGTFTLAAGNGFRMSSGVDTVNFLGGSASTVNGVNEGGNYGNGTNLITIYSNAVVSASGNFGVGYTGGVTNILVVNAGGTLNASGIGLSQAGSGMNSYLTNNGTISNSGGVTMNWQSGSNNNSTLMQLGGSFYNGGSSYMGGNNGNSTNSTALLDVVGGTFTNIGALNMGYQGVSNVNTFQIDGGSAYASSIVMGAGAAGASGGTNRINLNGGTFATKQFTLGASNAVAGEVNQINLNGGTLLAATGANTNFLASGIAAVAITGTGTINDGGQAITIGAPISDGSASGQLIKAGAGTLTLSGVNTFTGGSSLNAGGLNITSGSSLGAGDLSMSGGTKLAYTGIGASTLSNNISLSSGNGTIANSSGSALTLKGNLSDNGSLLTLASGTFNVGGSITGAYALSNATANLTGQTYGSSSASLLAGSTLNLGGNNNLTTAAALNFGATTDIATQTNTLNLAGYNQSVASISSLGGSGVNQIVDNSAFGGGTFSILGNSTFSGSIGGLTTTASQRNLNLTIGSGANVNLTGKNTYTGNTTIQQGAVLDLGGGGQLTGTSNVISNGGTLLLGGNGRTNSVDATANLNLNGGTLSMGGTNATSRTASQTFATLTLTGNSVIDFANLSGNSSLTFGNITMNGNSLAIYDWSGTHQWGTQSSTQVGTLTHLYDLNPGSLSSQDLNNISFYSGGLGSTFLGNAAFSGNEIVPVPEPGVIVAAALLLGWLIFANRGLLLAVVARRRV